MAASQDRTNLLGVLALFGVSLTPRKDAEAYVTDAHLAALAMEHDRSREDICAFCQPEGSV
jgi:hypothetical protein